MTHLVIEVAHCYSQWEWRTHRTFARSVSTFFFIDDPPPLFFTFLLFFFFLFSFIMLKNARLDLAVPVQAL